MPAPDAGREPDAGRDPDAGSQLPACRPGAREVRTVSEPRALEPHAEWRFAQVRGEDPHFAAFIAGAMESPSPGVDAAGVTWEAYELFAPHELGSVRDGVLYGVARVDVPEGQRVLARADRLFAVGTARGLAPGDPYGAGWARVPVLLDDGATDEVFVRVVGARGAAELELFSTPDEVHFNFLDRTFPHLRVGEDGEQWLGVMILNLTDRPLANVRARVVASDDWEATEIVHPSLPAGSVTQVAFRLAPARAWAAPGMVGATLQIESECLELAYEASTELEIVPPDATFHRTFRSAIDGSVQYYAVRPPSSFDSAREYALVLSLHGANVNARSQVDSYAPKDWAYIVSPTNRRPFGFDWEAWGRLDAIEVLEQAHASFRIDPTQVYLTGHSMGGHGTWQIGVHFPGRFALVGPSAGWSSFYSYGGAERPTGAFARSMASSDTNVYATNLARRAVYILHGDADDNVPVSEARAMRDLVTPITTDLGYYEQPGAGHWWDASPDVPGTDCVDWAPMFERMQAVRLDPNERTFEWRTPSTFVNARHSFVTITSTLTAEDAVVRSSETGGELTLTTENVRGMVLDTSALSAITRLTVDGAEVALAAGPIEIGPQTGKRPDRSGPFNQAMASPWCWVYPDDAAVHRFYSGWLASYFAIIGNGAGCALPASNVSDALRAERNLVWIGVPSVDTGVSGLPFEWDGAAITAGAAYPDAAIAFVYPSGERLDAFVFTTRGEEDLLYAIVPFTSRFALPDYLVYTRDGAGAAGFFDPEWQFPP